MIARRSKRLLLVVLAGSALAACSGRSPAPIHDRSGGHDQRRAVSNTRIKPPTRYVVRKGDTLYSIAWRFRLDHKVLGRWNGVGPLFTIFPGQKLRLNAPRGSPSGSRRSSRPVAVKPKPKAALPASRQQPTKPPAAAPATAPTAGLNWRWPVKGRVVKSFAANDPSAKGIDIEGELGQVVRAAAAGEVVYSGVGLIGYGELIIIKHDRQLLSAYGHNRKRLVKEGDRVQMGQRIAEMGKSDADRPLLHFEIRKDGQPVDPKGYLP